MLYWNLEAEIFRFSHYTQRRTASGDGRYIEDEAVMLPLSLDPNCNFSYKSIARNCVSPPIENISPPKPPARRFLCS